MYIDGHEHDDIVAYRKAFVDRFINQYAPRMRTWDNEGIPKDPKGYALPVEFRGRPFRLILVTHNESTFYANDQRTTDNAMDS